LSTSRIIAVTLDERSVLRRSADIEHERQVAIFDLLEANVFSLVERDAGPYRLYLSIEESRLVLDVRGEADDPVDKVALGLTSFRRVIKDYFQICESYFQAIKTASPSRIETLDMGRRGVHNEGSELLRERLKGKIEMDFDTARRLFTLICVLHLKT
jgi:uncharacterized protein (UPF0262 family)